MDGKKGIYRGLHTDSTSYWIIFGTACGVRVLLAILAIVTVIFPPQSVPVAILYAVTWIMGFIAESKTRATVQELLSYSMWLDWLDGGSQLTRRP